ncbi:MAG: FAD-dependent oxidoreductase [Alphaproteobacteria bacterium]|nr:FAD-dependent oxidoreductase [Alphaproteobacteria bacterium]
MKRVVIVGGGYAGTALARALDTAAEVVLVEAREKFFHNVAGIRGVVEPALLERIALPYDRLLKKGRVVRGGAVALTDRSVKLSNGDVIDGDIVVAATGSRYASPFKPQTDSVAALIAESRATHEQLRQAKSIAIVGAGAVGTELAGEIATGMRGKKITLISSTPTLFPGYPENLGRKLAAQLTAMGVTHRLATSARTLKQTHAPFAGRLDMTSGDPIDADLIFPVIGAKPVTDLLAVVPGVTRDTLGRAKVDAWLRPTASATLFALGDAAAAGDAMTIVAITRQEPWLAKAIKALLAGKKLESLAPYTPWPTPAILIPLGAKKGASVLPVTKKGMVVGPFLTSAVKGKQLFIPRYRKEFGQSA